MTGKLNRLVLDNLEAYMNREMLHPLISKGSITVVSANAGNMKTSLVLNIVKHIKNQFDSIDFFWFDYDIGLMRAMSKSGEIATELLSYEKFFAAEIGSSKEHESVKELLSELGSKDKLTNAVIVFDGLQSLFGMANSNINKPIFRLKNLPRNTSKPLKSINYRNPLPRNRNINPFPLINNFRLPK